MKDSKYIYEVIVVLNPKTEVKIKEKTIKTVEEKIAEMGFLVDNREDMGSKELAYEIKKCTKGDFWVFSISGKKPVKLEEFDLFLNREPSIIRYLILKK